MRYMALGVIIWDVKVMRSIRKKKLVTCWLGNGNWVNGFK